MGKVDHGGLCQGKVVSVSTGGILEREAGTEGAGDGVGCTKTVGLQKMSPSSSKSQRLFQKTTVSPQEVTQDQGVFSREGLQSRD